MPDCLIPVLAGLIGGTDERGRWVPRPHEHLVEDLRNEYGVLLGRRRCGFCLLDEGSL